MKLCLCQGSGAQCDHELRTTFVFGVETDRASHFGKLEIADGESEAITKGEVADGGERFEQVGTGFFGYTFPAVGDDELVELCSAFL